MYLQYAILPLIMEETGTSETSVHFTRLHGAASQKTDNFIPADVRLSNSTALYIRVISKPDSYKFMKVL
jgi:hypothetical protein